MNQNEPMHIRYEQIVCGVCRDGKSYKQIAQELNLSVSHVKALAMGIRDSLNVTMHQTCWLYGQKRLEFPDGIGVWKMRKNEVRE